MTIAKAISLAVLCAAAVGAAAAQTPQEESVARQQITSTLHQMYEAEKRRDLQFVLANLAEDFAEVAGDGGIYHRADIEAGWADVQLKDYTLTDCVFKLINRDAAYLSCQMQVEATYKSQPFPKAFRVTYFWTRQEGKWLLRFEQGTVIPEAPKKD